MKRIEGPLIFPPMSTSLYGRSGDEPAGISPARLLDAHGSRVFYRWGRLLCSTLVDVRARFAGDLDQYLIFMVFLLDDLSRQTPIRAGDRREHARGMNRQSIAEITDIPRETCRRKLQMLVADGYLTRSYDGLYHLGGRYGMDQFFADLSPLFMGGLSLGSAPPAA